MSLRDKLVAYRKRVADGKPAFCVFDNKTIDAIVDACRRTRLFKYEDVSVRLVGSNAGRALEASLLMFCFGVRAAPFDDILMPAP